jgi:transcriptional regulator with GAF, ATPase, and Fis domain
VTVASTSRASDQKTLAPRVSIDASELAIAQSGRLDVSAHSGVETLYRFTDRLFRARSRSEACDAALDAIREALGCERASILLFDDLGCMRFVAWRGLSDDYRRAVDGHSPWTKDTKDPLPICIENVDSADLDDTLKATIKAEGIRALAFVPLFTRGELAGKFMTYCDTPRAFTDAEIDLAVTVARQLGFSLERMQAGQALLEAQRQLLSELAATQQLHKISTQLIQENEQRRCTKRLSTPPWPSCGPTSPACSCIIRNGASCGCSLTGASTPQRRRSGNGFDRHRAAPAASRWQPGSGRSSPISN